MVLDDFFHTKRKAEQPEIFPERRARHFDLETRLASPVDRMAAAVADAVLVVPLITLVVSPFSLRAKEAQLLGANEAWLNAVFAAIAVAIFALIIYQTVSVAIFGATPGKRVLKLRVVSIWTGEKPQPLDAFTRGLVLAGEFCLLGVPLLSMFSNERRRPLHDRAADTAVIVLAPSRRAGLALLPEMSIFSGFQSACMAILVLVHSVYYVQYLRHHDVVLEAIHNREAEGRLCPEIREAIEETSARKVSAIKDRLEVALALFNSGSVASECLEDEAEFALWRDQALPLAYLAKGLASAERNESAGLDYFEKACQAAHAAGAEYGDVCRVATLARSGIEEELDEGESDETEARLASVRREAEIEAVLAGLTGESQAYLKIAAIRHMLANGEVERALVQLDSLHESRRIGVFVTRERAKALWRLGKKTEGMAAMRAVIDLADRPTRVEIARWFCHNETDFGKCGERSRSACAELKTVIGKDEDSLAKPEIAATYIRAETCGVRKPEWRELAERIPQTDAKDYLESLAMIDEGEVEAGRDKLQALANASGSRAAAFVLEANTQLIARSQTREELEVFKANWENLDPGDSDWQAIGRHLLVKLGNLGAWEDAIKIGLRMVQSDPSDRQTYALMIAAAKGAGKLRFAMAMLAQIPGRKPAALSSPAAGSESLDSKDEP